MTASPPAHTKASREDWINAAITALTDEGLGHVKVLLLARRLDVSRSSFYWYFESRQDLLDELLAIWRINTTSIVERTVRDSPTIVAAVLGVFECWADERLFKPGLDFAVRDWARRDPVVKIEVEQADQLRLDAIAAMFTDHGYTRDDSIVRARLLYQGQVGYYAVGTDEATELRLLYLPYYLRALTGAEPSSSELNAWEAFLDGVGTTGA